MSKKILSIVMVLILGFLLLFLTGCGNQEQENHNVENIENTENNIEQGSSEEGIEVGENVLRYGKYEGNGLAEGVIITLNSNETFEYEDERNNSGEGTYEVRNEEIEDIEGTYETWVIEFNSIVIASNDYIPGDYYMLFTQTGDISNEEAGINFNYVGDEENTEEGDTLSVLERTEIDTFNASFEQYEGELRGPQVKALLSQVNSSNIANTDKIVTVENNGEEISSTEDISNLSSRIATAMTYNITLEYENELVSKIIIE